MNRTLHFETLQASPPLSLIVSSSRRTPPNGFTPSEEPHPERRAAHLPGREALQRRDSRPLAVIGHPAALKNHRRRFMHPLESPSIVRRHAIAAQKGRGCRFTIPLQIHTTEFTNPTRSLTSSRMSRPSRRLRAPQYLCGEPETGALGIDAQAALPATTLRGYRPAGGFPPLARAVP